MVRFDDSARVLLNDFRTQWRDIAADSVGAFERVGASGWYILGEEVLLFEHQVAARFGLAEAVGCGNGLDALEIALRVCGMKQGDLVLTTPLSAFATTLAILRAGGRPVFVDVDDSGLIDLEAADRQLHEHPEIRFFLPVHLYGHALDLDRLEQIRDKHGITVVEDCAQAIGAKWKGRTCGSVGAASAVSFYPTKNLGGLGDAGAVVTNDPTVADKARALRNYGQTDRYQHDELGLNSRLDEVQAAILTDALLPRLDSFTSRRRAIAHRYQASIENPRIGLPMPPVGSESVWHLFPILVSEGRDDLQAHLSAKGIDTATHYPTCIPDQRVMTPVSGSIPTEIENARRFAGAELSIPIHPYMSRDDVDRVIDGCNSWG